MKKLLVLLMAFSFFIAACNNDKTGKNQNTNNRDKDDYGKNDNPNKDDKNTNKDDNKDEGNQMTGWSSSDIRSFNAQCLVTMKNNDEVARVVCPCLLEKFQAKYASLGEMDRIGTEEEGRKAGEACSALITGINNNTENNNWSRSDEKAFMADCEGPAAENVGAVRANQYCNCMLQKMEKMYSGYAETNRKLGGKTKAEIAQLAADCNGQ